MEIRRIRTLRGPNIWSRKVCLEAWVDLGDLKDTSSDAVPGFTDRLMALLPGLIEHRCSVGERGGFLQRLQRGTYPAHILEHTCLELQTMAGMPVGFGKARETSEEGVYRVVVRYREEPVARSALLLARDLLMALYAGRDFELAGPLAALQELAEDAALGPSTTAIVTAAEARGIPTRRLNTGSLVQLGQGVRQRRIWTAETDATSAIAETIAQDKELTKQLLRGGGVPVPEGRLVDDADDAWAAAGEVGLPVVVKPQDGNHGRGVCVNLTSEAEVRAGYESARKEGSGVIVETYAPGSEHRLLVVGHKLVAAAKGDTAYVTGDGQSSVAGLVERQLNSDPRRGESHNSPLAYIDFDEPTLLVLKHQGLTPDGVPAEGQRVLIQQNGNLRIDCTDEVHPSVAAHVELASKIVGLDVTGIDVVAVDISRPLEEQGGVIVELNASPGLHAHLMPGVGRPRPVGEAIIATLFPEGETGRIPVVAVTGTNGKTSVARLVAHLLATRHGKVGLACSDGLWIGGRLLDQADCGGPRSARRVLSHPEVEAAVFEAGRGGILREGLGFDRCDVAVVTNIAEGDHLGRASVETPDDLFTVKRCPVDVVPKTGASVLNAADPLVADMARLSDGAVLFFALDASHPVVVAHRSAGGRALLVKDGALVDAEGPRETAFAAIENIPAAMGGRVPFVLENLLAAAAAGLSLGLSHDEVSRGLASFPIDANPGRFERFNDRDAQIVVDDAHNIPALRSLIAGLDGLRAGLRTVVYSAGANRRDEDVVAQGELLAAAFDRVVVYEDQTASDRTEGELTALLRRGLAKGGRVREVVDIADQQLAIDTARRLVKPGEWLVIQTEDGSVAPTLATVQELVGAAD